MRKIARALILGGMVLIAGCNSSSTTTERPEQVNAMPAATPQSTEAASNPRMATKPDSRPVIVCFGDSLTAGYGVDADEAYPSRLQEDLDLSGYHYHVVNMGISGETTKDGLARVERVLALHPAITVVEFGGNDGLRGVPVTSSRANLEAIVSQLKPSGTKIALAGITLPPQFGKTYIQQFDETYRLIAKKYDIPLYPFLLKDVYGVPGSIQRDGVHPTPQGCRQVAKNVMGFLRPMLKK